MQPDSSSKTEQSNAREKGTQGQQQPCTQPAGWHMGHQLCVRPVKNGITGSWTAGGDALVTGSSQLEEVTSLSDTPGPIQASQQAGAL